MSECSPVLANTSTSTITASYIAIRGQPIAVSHPIRAGEFCNSHVRIPDWIVCGAGRFTPIHTVSYPIRVGEFCNSHVRIPDWIVCGASWFTPIQTSLETVRSSPRGPYLTEWRENSLCKHSILHVLCCSDGKDVSINRSTRTANQSLISLRQDRRIYT